MQKTITSTLLSLSTLLFFLLMATAAKAQESGESDSDARFEIRSLTGSIELRGPLKAWIPRCYGSNVEFRITAEDNSTVTILCGSGDTTKVLIVRPPYPDFF